MALKRRARVEPEFSLAAMIDVIFLLLMFFMLSSNFVTPNALNLQLPSSSSKSTVSPTVSVVIEPSGIFKIDNRTVLRSSLGASVRSKLVGRPKTDAVQIMADKTVPVDDVVYVLDIINKLGYKSILATQPGKGE